MKRLVTAATQPVEASSVSSFRQIKKLATGIDNVISIMNEMDDEAFAKVESTLGKQFYTDMLDAFQDISTIK